MTMDVNHRKVESQVLLNNNAEEVTKVPVKRSFDVAFLMLPDDKLKQKQLRAARQLATQQDFSCEPPECSQIVHVEEEDDRRSETDSPGFGRGVSDLQKMQQHAKYLSNIAHLGKQQIFGDPSLGKAKHYDDDDVRLKVPSESASPIQKSAFTKVNMLPKERISPNPSISPDLSYQHSLSPSPPILRHQYQNYQHFKTSQNYQNAFLQVQDNLAGFSASANQANVSNQSLMDFAATKMRPVLQYRPDFAPYGAYSTFPPQEILKMNSPDSRHPTAAIFSSLLPPSLAALSLPAQNVCAKCNISFRMTSDLVYHMRSHHKNDVMNDMSKRRREEKLKCPVCAESFRERHHLTRHMTAHQDKEGDALDGDEIQGKKKGSALAAGSSNFGVFNK